MSEHKAAGQLYDHWAANDAHAREVDRVFKGCNGNCAQGRFCDCVPDVPLPLFAADKYSSLAIAVVLVVACVVLALILSAKAPMFMQWVVS